MMELAEGKELESNILHRTPARLIERERRQRESNWAPTFFIVQHRIPDRDPTKNAAKSTASIEISAVTSLRNRS